MNRRTSSLIAILGVLPCVAFADTGTPLVWASGFHMAFGNAILGLLEGWVLSKVFKLHRNRCIWLLIAANYTSAWLGVFIVDALRTSQEIDIYNALRISFALIGITYIFTLVLEWPFIALCFWRTPHWFPRSLKASLLVQTLSYLLLFSGFWFVSGKSLYSDFSIVSQQNQTLPKGVLVYFISRDDGNIYCRSQNKERTLVAELGSTNRSDHLRFQESKTNTNLWDLVAVRDRNYDSENAIIISKNIITNTTDAVWLTQQFWAWGRAPQIGSATNSMWHFRWGHWPTVGLYGDNTTGQSIHVAFGNPVMSWPMCRAIHLPEEMVLFQLGWDQLCLLNIERKTISLWERGQGPVALESKK